MKERKTHSRHFSDRELDSMPGFTPEEEAALPRAWTKRGEMLSFDKQIIQALVDKSRMAARIFVTGEASDVYLGEEAASLLISINDVYYKNGAGAEPLFVETRGETIRMTRFDPAFVWRCFHPDILVDLFREEIDRLGLTEFMDPLKMDDFDFYQAMASALREECGRDGLAFVRGASTIDDLYYGAYLSCLLLFNKPGYMDVPVAEHFASADAAKYMRRIDMYTLSGEQQKRLRVLREEYGGIRTLTNPEMDFVLDVIEGVVKK